MILLSLEIKNEKNHCNNRFTPTELLVHHIDTGVNKTHINKKVF